MKIKKILSVFLVIVLSAAYITSAMANSSIGVMIDGNQIDFDVSPQVINNRTMVPLRKIFESLGAVVDWDNATKTVTATKDNTTVVLTIGNSKIYVNGSSIALDTPACVVNNRTLVPVRAISEAFGAEVNWDSVTQTVIISNNNKTSKKVDITYSDLYNQYYRNTSIPNYSSVIGERPNEIWVRDKNYIYMYNYTEEGDKIDMVEYMLYLYTYGWKEYDNESDDKHISYYFVKDGELVSVTYEAELNEVWIGFQDKVI